MENRAQTRRLSEDYINNYGELAPPAKPVETPLRGYAMRPRSEDMCLLTIDGDQLAKVVPETQSPSQNPVEISLAKRPKRNSKHGRAKIFNLRRLFFLGERLEICGVEID